MQNAKVWELIWISKFISLYELLAHPQKVILLVSGLLYYIKESILKYNFSNLKELIIQK